MIKNYSKSHKIRNVILETIDIMFIMVLCFSTLLTAMLFKGNVGIEMDYTVNWGSFLMVIIALLSYFFMILKQAKKELNDMIRTFESDDEKINYKMGRL